MKTKRSLLYVFCSGILLLAAGQCRSRSNEALTFPDTFQTDYRLEVDDGQSTFVYEGNSTSGTGQRFSDYPGDDLMFIYPHVENDVHNDAIRSISGMILLDEKRNLLPFGKVFGLNEFRTSLIITTRNSQLYSSNAGSQHLTDVHYYTQEHKKYQGRVAYLYTFNNVLFIDPDHQKEYRISGYIQSRALN